MLDILRSCSKSILRWFLNFSFEVVIGSVLLAIVMCQLSSSVDMSVDSPIVAALSISAVITASRRLMIAFIELLLFIKLCIKLRRLGNVKKQSDVAAEIIKTIAEDQIPPPPKTPSGVRFIKDGVPKPPKAPPSRRINNGRPNKNV